MRRDQLEHAIRAACQISGREEVIVVGSQAILGSLDESRLPIDATMSAEIDILPIAATDEETRELGDQIEGVAGELSTFQETHGFGIDGVDLSTSVLPRGWRNRLIKVQNENTAGSSGGPQYVGWCLDKEDLCVSQTHRAPGEGPSVCWCAGASWHCRRQHHQDPLVPADAGAPGAGPRGSRLARAMAGLTSTRPHQ